MLVALSDWSAEMSANDEMIGRGGYNHDRPRRQYNDHRRGGAGGANRRRRNNDEDQTVLDKHEVSSVASLEGMILILLKHNTQYRILFSIRSHQGQRDSICILG